MPNIFHISNTDVSIDSRIVKELGSLGEISDVRLFAIGVPEIQPPNISNSPGLEFIYIHLVSRQLSFLPRAIRYFFELIEFTFKSVRVARQRRADLVHCHDTFALPAGWIIKFLTGCKLVYDAHELESNKNGQNKALSLATLWIEKFCWPKVDLLVSVSDSIIDWYQVNFSKKSSVLVLNSPLIAQTTCEADVKAVKSYFHKKFDIPSDHQIFVYLGILAPGRGIEMCLDAFEQTSGKASVVFIGFGPLESMIIERTQRTRRVFFHAAVPHDQVVGLVAHADFGICLIENVSLSDYLCLPNKLFEYSFAGLPILASDFPEIRKVVEKYSLGVCCEPTVSDLSEKISELENIQPKYTIESIYELSWQVQANRLRAAYSELL